VFGDRETAKDVGGESVFSGGVVEFSEDVSSKRVAGEMAASRQGGLEPTKDEGMMLFGGVKGASAYDKGRETSAT